MADNDFFHIEYHIHEQQLLNIENWQLVWELSQKGGQAYNATNLR